MQDIKVTEEEMKALAQFADSEGQVGNKAGQEKLYNNTKFVFNTIKFSF